MWGGDWDWDQLNPEAGGEGFQEAAINEDYIESGLTQCSFFLFFPHQGREAHGGAQRGHFGGVCDCFDVHTGLD